MDLISEIKLLVKEIKKLKKEMPGNEKYQALFRMEIAEATKKLRELREHIKDLDLKGRR